MSPPHMRPTESPDSSLKPNSQTIDRWPVIAVRAASTIADSTQPPEIDPMVRVSSRTAIDVPMGRGTDPETAMTVATAHRSGDSTVDE